MFLLTRRTSDQPEGAVAALGGDTVMGMKSKIALGAVVGIVVIGVIGYAMELAIRKIENWAVPWRGHE